MRTTHSSTSPFPPSEAFACLASPAPQPFATKLRTTMFLCPRKRSRCAHSMRAAKIVHAVIQRKLWITSGKGYRVTVQRFWTNRRAAGRRPDCPGDKATTRLQSAPLSELQAIDVSALSCVFHRYRPPLLTITTFIYGKLSKPEELSVGSGTRDRPKKVSNHYQAFGSPT